MQGRQMRQISRVWVEDENGKLKLIFIRTGVTDNSYTEIKGENLKEGQEVITGVSSGQEDRSSRNPMRGMMRMMR